MGTNLYQPNESPDETPIVRYASRAGAVLTVLALLGIIGFIFFESAMDYMGKPLYEEPPPVPAPPVMTTEPLPESLTPAAIEAEAEALVETLSKEFEFITPTGDVIVEGGRPLPIICIWRSPRRELDARPPVVPTLEIDYQPVQWNAIFGRNVWYAEAELEHGKHGLLVVGNERNLFVRDLESASGEKAPPDWKPMPSHPDTDDPDKCTDCHRLEPVRGLAAWKSEVFAQNDAIAGLRDHKACMECHPALEFELKHQHILEPLQDCELCHAIHGTTVMEKGLLKRSKVELCSQCHDPDH